MKCKHCSELNDVGENPRVYSGSIKSIYIIGSLRNPEIPSLANDLEKLGLDVFADWFCPGEFADDKWKEFYQARHKTYRDAINGPMAHCIFNFDKSNLDRTDAAVLLKPAGQSAAYELGYTIGRGKPGFILYPKEPEPSERWEVMARFATDIFFSREEFFKSLTEKYLITETAV
jgi:hypothetical protein